MPQIWRSGQFESKRIKPDTHLTTAEEKQTARHQPIEMWLRQQHWGLKGAFHNERLIQQPGRRQFYASMVYQSTIKYLRQTMRGGTWAHQDKRDFPVLFIGISRWKIAIITDLTNDSSRKQMLETVGVYPLSQTQKSCLNLEDVRGMVWG